MLKYYKMFVVLISVFLALMLIGCSQTDNARDDDSGISLTASQDSSDADYANLPDEDFDLSQQTNSDQSGDKNYEKNDKTSSASQNSVADDASSADDNQEKGDAPSYDSSSEVTSSDEADITSKNQDDGLELPIDKW